MKLHLPVTIGPDLTVAIGAASTRITPAIGLRLAEKLIRTSTRQLVQQTTEQAVRTRSATLRKPTAT